MDDNLKYKIDSIIWIKIDKEFVPEIFVEEISKDTLYFYV